jgi:hypothetical protein
MVVTLSIDPYTPLTVPLVRTRELRFGQSGRPETRHMTEGTSPDSFWTIGGRLASKKPLDLEKTTLILVERGEKVGLQPDGQFTIGRLRAGAYTLEVAIGSDLPRRFPITVPAEDCVLDV